MENAVIEVAVGLPDAKHLSQIAMILESPDSEVWLLTRENRADVWRKALEESEDIEPTRVVVSSVEGFIGQNISELGEFSSLQKSSQMELLFSLYNERWVKGTGAKGINIVVK